ncbi:MAG: hypothetical protein OXS35_09945 [Dehalococcoidia bacterium]|nr:hypothetical protein [Dehalococcoidia bacterium]
MFAEAVEIDTIMRGRLAFAREPYLHPRRIPLAEAVRLDQAEMGAGPDRDGLGNECEGHCGIWGMVRPLEVRRENPLACHLVRREGFKIFQLRHLRSAKGYTSMLWCFACFTPLDSRLAAFR